MKTLFTIIIALITVAASAQGRLSRILTQMHDSGRWEDIKEQIREYNSKEQQIRQTEVLIKKGVRENWFKQETYYRQDGKIDSVAEIGWDKQKNRWANGRWVLIYSYNSIGKPLVISMNGYLEDGSFFETYYDSFKYDNNNFLIERWERDLLSRSIQYKYNSKGLLVEEKTIGSLFSQYNYTYNSMDVLIEVVDTTENSKKLRKLYNYDSSGKLKEILALAFANGDTVSRDLYFYTAATGINEPNTNNVAVYPNPAQNYLYISSAEGFATGTEISIINLYGQEMYKEIINAVNDSNTLQISTENLPAGCYFVRMSSPAGLIENKIIINK